VRELENCLERSAILSETGVIDRDMVTLAGISEEAPEPRAPVAVPAAALDDPDLDERERVIAALEQAGWVQARAARLLGMTPRQIAYRIQTLNIRMRRF
jgi:Nif-specific regulatory protein